MADVIEEAKSSRSTCRTCRQKIDKGALRFGEETANAFSPDGGTSYLWHHLACAAGRVPLKVRQALTQFPGAVPDREELEKILAAPPKGGGRGGAKGNYPYVERAATGRSRCLGCDEPIDKGTLRIAVQREVDTGSFQTTGPGYLHPMCAAEYTADDELLAKLKANTPGLSDDDVAELAGALA